MDDLLDSVLTLQESWVNEGVAQGIAMGRLDQDAFELGVKKVFSSVRWSAFALSRSFRVESSGEKLGSCWGFARRFAAAFLRTMFAGQKLPVRLIRWKRR